MKRNQLFTGCVFLCMLYAFPASAQTLTKDFKFIASDAAEFDQFGSSIAISGNTAIVGTPFDDDAGDGSGSAYLFDTTAGLELFKLTATDAAAGDEFGNSVAISGGIAIVGADEDDDAGDGSGSAYLFDTTTGLQLFKLTANDAAANDAFGHSVAIFGTTAIVGTPFDDDTGSISGSAYIFDTTTGLQLFKLTASDAAESDSFGYSVAISGTTVIVGARGDNSSTGAAYVFDSTTGLQLFKLTASDGAFTDNFGGSVAISGTTAIVGARFSDDAGFFSNSGSAHIFDTTTGQQLFKLTASDAEIDDYYGSSVAISSAGIIVGANGDDDAGSGSGSAYVFIRPPEITSQPQSIIVSPGETAVFNVGVTSPGARVYRWRRDGVEMSNGGNISGALSPSLQIVAQPGDAAIYDCVITNPLEVVSEEVILSVRSDPNECVVDLNDDGELDFFDVSEFLTLFGMGCP